MKKKKIILERSKPDSRLSKVIDRLSRMSRKFKLRRQKNRNQKSGSKSLTI